MAYAPHWTTLATPVGTVIVRGTGDAVDSITICAAGESLDPHLQSPAHGAVADAARQIAAYFAGELRRFDVPLVAAQTSRGAALRQAILDISYGESITYGELARHHGSSARAVGQACARNPFPIVIPCHRVTSAHHAPERYSAGNGTETKCWLLAHEARTMGKLLL